MSRDAVRDVLRLDDGRLWLLVLLCVALVFTIQSVESSTEGAWPHHRRPARLGPGGRAVQGVWSVVGLLLLPGLLVGVLNLAILIWQDLASTRTLALGALLVGLVWLLFVAVSANLIGLGRLMAQVGPVGPAALLAILIVGDILLIVALLEISPPLSEIRDAVPFIS